MIASPAATPRPAIPDGARARARGWVRPALLLGGLGTIVSLRRLALEGGRVDAILVGAIFGLALAVLAAAALGFAIPRGDRLPPVRPAVALGLGVGGGLALVALALVARVGTPVPTFTPALAFGPWVAVTLLVAGAEELLLRGVLFGAVERAGGVALAVGVTSLAFALMHVPVYGWHVVPLDLGVGIFLGGLRLAGGGWQGPAVAHAVADLATWWL
jgi:membrane protease YdiL (CAAX protease family)